MIVLPLIGFVGLLIHLAVVPISPVGLGLLLLASVPWIVKSIRAGSVAEAAEPAVETSARDREPSPAAEPKPLAPEVRQGAPKPAPARTAGAGAAQPRPEPARAAAAPRSQAARPAGVGPIARLPGFDDADGAAEGGRAVQAPVRTKPRSILGSPDV